MSTPQLSVQPYKGTRDFYPEDMRLRNWFFGKIRQVLECASFDEYNGPMLESLDIYAAKSGVELASEQTYNFTDRGGRQLAIRPEMTPTVARMVAQKVNGLSYPLRWFSIPNFYRYERPQRGRLREFWQVNADIFGCDSYEADFEIISVAIKLLRVFGADESMFKVHINNRRFFNDVIAAIAGSDAEGALYTMSIYEATALCPDSRGSAELKELFGTLAECGLDKYCVFDFGIIRGLDYYTGTVFEVFDEAPENNRAMFGGGRYDNLVGLFVHNTAISGVGFGFGDVTLENFLNIHKLVPASLLSYKVKLLVTRFNDVSFAEYEKLADELILAGIPAMCYLGTKKFGKQIDYAVTNGCTHVIIMGGSELEGGEVKIKDLTTREEKTVARAELVNYINSL